MNLGMKTIRKSFPAVAFFVCEGLGMCQTLSVDRISIPGVTFTAALSIDDSGSNFANEVMGISLSPNVAAWMPFAVAIKNTSTQPIAAIAVKWTKTAPDATTSTAILRRNFFDPNLQLKPGHSLIGSPVFLYDQPQNQAPGSSDLQGTTDTELLTFKSAKSVVASLDGILYSSGQFVGPNTIRSFEELQAASTAGPTVAKKALTDLESNQGTADIVKWLEEEAVQKQIGSFLNRDFNMFYTVHAAQQLLRAYSRNGESGLASAAQRVMKQASITVYR